jgi:hypothetical protein
MAIQIERLDKCTIRAPVMAGAGIVQRAKSLTFRAFPHDSEKSAHLHLPFLPA